MPTLIPLCSCVTFAKRLSFGYAHFTAWLDSCRHISCMRITNYLMTFMSWRNGKMYLSSNMIRYHRYPHPMDHSNGRYGTLPVFAAFFPHARRNPSPWLPAPTILPFHPQLQSRHRWTTKCHHECAKWQPPIILAHRPCDGTVQLRSRILTTDRSTSVPTVLRIVPVPFPWHSWQKNPAQKNAALPCTIHLPSNLPMDMPITMLLPLPWGGNGAAVLPPYLPLVRHHRLPSVRHHLSLSVPMPLRSFRRDTYIT